MGVAKYTKDEKGRITDVMLQSGIHVKPVYGPEDLERIGFSYEKDLADPGKYPFTRGIHPAGLQEQGLDHATVHGLRHARPRRTSGSSS